MVCFFVHLDMLVQSPLGIQIFRYSDIQYLTSATSPVGNSNSVRLKSALSQSPEIVPFLQRFKFPSILVHKH